MTLTTTIDNFSSDGSFLARGSTSDIDDGETVDTGLRSSVIRFSATAHTADTVVTMTSQSSGVATLAIKTASGAGNAVTIDWVAWAQPYKT